METRIPRLIHIRGQEIPCSFHELNIDGLSYLPESRRIKSLLPANWNTKTHQEQQQLVQKLLQKESSVTSLMQRVLDAGGLNEPIFVRMDTETVIEGNSRLCVYRQLYEKAKESGIENADKWKMIPCKTVSGLTPEQQQLYLDNILRESILN